VLYDACSAVHNAHEPTTVFQTQIRLAVIAILPIAVLSYHDILSLNARYHIATLSLPVVLYLNVSVPIPTL
jgi:hypothetical protein